jgi:hypothetical protein
MKTYALGQDNFNLCIDNPDCSSFNGLLRRIGKRFVVRAEEKLTASPEPEAAALGLQPGPICDGLALLLKG